MHNINRATSISANGSFHRPREVNARELEGLISGYHPLWHAIIDNGHMHFLFAVSTPDLSFTAQLSLLLREVKSDLTNTKRTTPNHW
jgi:hypothetical protein